MRRYILIDANIARSCADPARHETSSACLSLLLRVARKGSSVDLAVSPLLQEEWINHASKYFIKWYASMTSRGRVKSFADKRVNDYRDVISNVADDGVRQALIKDAHVVELALIHHFPVASQDDRQARYVRDISATYSLARRVQWFNPVTTPGWVEWIDSACSDTELFMLGDCA
jgi:hypothetical protein